MCSCSLVTLLIHSEKHWRLIRCHCIVQGFTNMVMKINRIQSLTGWFVLCCKQALGEQCGGCPHEKLWPCPSAWKPETIQPYHQELPQKRWAPFTEKGASQPRAMSGVSSVAWWFKNQKRSLRLVSHERVEFEGFAGSQFWRALHWCSSYPHMPHAENASIMCIQTSEYNCKFELNTNARI